MSLESNGEVKKLVSVSATSTPVTGTRKKVVEATKIVESGGAGKDSEKSKSKYPENFAQVSYIRYFINCKKKSVLAILDSGSKDNAIHSAFAKKLHLPIRPINIEVQKIDGNMLDNYEMVVAAFLLKNKTNRVRFFEETFLVANVSPKVVLRMIFFTLSRADIDFSSRKLRWRTYTIEETLPTTRRVKLIGKKKFAAAILDPEHETYIVYIRSVSSNVLPTSFLLNVHPF